MENSTLDLLSAEVAKVLYKDTVDPDLAIGDLGVDSMRAVELVLICGQLYETEIEIEELKIDQFTSLRDLDRQFKEMAERQRQAKVVA